MKINERRKYKRKVKRNKREESRGGRIGVKESRK